MDFKVNAGGQHTHTRSHFQIELEYMFVAYYTASIGGLAPLMFPQVILLSVYMRLNKIEPKNLFKVMQANIFKALYFIKLKIQIISIRHLGGIIQDRCYLHILKIFEKLSYPQKMFSNPPPHRNMSILQIPNNNKIATLFLYSGTA